MASRNELALHFLSNFVELLIVKVKAESVSTGVEVTFDPEAYVESFKPDMMEVLYAWSKGAKFREICKMTDHFEVRYMLHCFHPVL